MKEITVSLKGLETGDMLDLIALRHEAKRNKEKTFCGFYRMNPLYATPKGFVLQIPDDEPEHLYQ